MSKFANFDESVAAEVFYSSEIISIFSVQNDYIDLIFMMHFSWNNAFTYGFLIIRDWRFLTKYILLYIIPFSLSIFFLFGRLTGTAKAIK